MRKSYIDEVENPVTGRIEFFVKITENKKFIAEALFDHFGDASKWAREKTNG